MSTSPDQQPQDPEVAGAEPQPKKPWTKGRIAVFAGGGCCALLVLAFAAIVILGLIVGPTETDAPTATPAPSSSAEPSEETTRTEVPSEEPTTEAPTTAEEAPEETTTTEPAAVDPAAWAAEMEQTALAGAADWQEACGGDYSLGICWISDVTADEVGTLRITLQLTGKDEESEYYAEGAANYVLIAAGFEHEDLETVRVYSADGLDLASKTRSDIPGME